MVLRCVRRIGIQVIWHPETRTAEVDVALSQSRCLTDGEIAEVTAEVLSGQKVTGEKATRLSPRSGRAGRSSQPVPWHTTPLA